MENDEDAAEKEEGGAGARLDRNVIVLLAVCGALLLGLLIWSLWPRTVTLSQTKASTTLPVAGGEWKRIEMDESHNSSTSVLELEHGWLVYRQNGFGGGMAFVPKN